jgi:hypothetical protein
MVLSVRAALCRAPGDVATHVPRAFPENPREMSASPLSRTETTVSRATVSCNQSGTAITYSFTGSLAAGASIALYYSTRNASEAAATGIPVTASACP